MTEPTPDPNRPGCRQLLKLVEALRARIEALEADLAKLKKTSATSSKPPSSAFAAWREDCEEVQWAELPLEVRKGGLVGPRLSALIAQVKGGCHSSYSTIQTLLAKAMGVSLSRGMIAKVVRKATRALEAPCKELLQKLPGEQTLDVDETGHKEHGKKLWTWYFRATSYTVFRIDQSRGSDVLFRILGKELDGVLGCDYFSAYSNYMGKASAQVQFCFARLIRDVRFLTTLPVRNAKAHGERVLEKIRALLRVIHRRERMSPERFHKRLEQARNALLKTARHGSSRYSAARDIAERFRKHGEAYVHFITSPGVEPTNNLACAARGISSPRGPSVSWSSIARSLREHAA